MYFFAVLLPRLLLEDISLLFLSLNFKKRPTVLLISFLLIFFSFLCTNNSSFKSSLFPSCLKMADVTPLHKKGKKDLKENYRPVSILPVFSKVFERSMFAQMSSFFDNFLSKQQCGFRKGYSTQQCLLALLEKWKRAVDSGQMFGALLTDLSIRHLIASITNY